jgi:membrane protein required for colicin V production
MNILDFLFILTILLSILFGILKGFVREVIGLAFLVLAVYGSVSYYQDVARGLFSAIDQEDVAFFLAFLLIFFSVLILGSLLSYTAKKIFLVGPLKGIDRILGAFFGVLRGCIISCILLALLTAYPINPEWVSGSRLAPYAESPLNWIISLLPPTLFEKAREKV